MPLPPERVYAASAAWVFIPPSAGRIECSEYLALRYPTWYEHPLQLVGILPGRPLDEVLDEVLDRCRAAVGTAEPRILCWVRLGAPEGLDDALLARGGVLEETLDVLARQVDGAVAALAPPAGADVRWADDMATFSDAVGIGAEVFGGDRPDETGLGSLLAGEQEKLRTGGGGSVVAYVDGRPVASGGVSIAGPDARLWGGGVLPDARGRGLYRALLAARLEYAEQHGAELALVKGRVETSAPVLRRAGFTAYGQERSYLLPL